MLKNIDVREFKSGMTSKSIALSKYLDDIRKFPILDIDEEVKLFDRIKEGDESAREKLINCNQRFVYAIAKRYTTTDKIMDLISEGNIGLMYAIDKFDSTKGLRFLSYAVWHIRRCILYYLMTDNMLIKKTNNAKCNNKVNIIKNKYFCENGTWPTDEEIIESLEKEFGITIGTISDVYELQTNSINDTYMDFEEKTVEESPDFVKKTHSDNEYLIEVDNDYNQTIVKGMTSRLTERERKIIQLFYGINCDKEYTFSEIGNMLGICKERVRQLKCIAINKLKNMQVQNFA